MAQLAEASKEVLYTKESKVWVPDPAKVWKSAEIVQDWTPQSKFLVIRDEENGDESQLPIKSAEDLPHLRNPHILIGLNDLTSLSYLHEPAVLYNLDYRFTNHNAIYTYCGIVLVAINPYEELPIYSPDTIWAYRGQAMGNLDPHIFAVAEEAYTKMERDGKDQSIIVSGESGAGKTVSAKYAMRYFATVGGSKNETQIERKVLASSPIMEAIGNAKTTRNDNSSRFGKFVELQFDSKFAIMGASMRTYLLEKSRVVFQSDAERNYHIFYQMCAARKDHAELSNLGLDEITTFHYTSHQTRATKISGVSDAKSFEETLEALQLLGFGVDDRRNFFKLLAAVLHLGNVKIQGDTDSCSIAKDDKHLKTFCLLLSIDDVDSMRKWLCNRRIVSGGEEIIKCMSESEATFCRDALAKLLYAEGFNWIVSGVNRSLQTSAKSHRFIGVLDIYGFETFQVNSFEQFCINYANEKLQLQFNQHVFKLEQEEYVKEGIECAFISYYDNQPCIELIEAKLGILSLLDEQCRMPQGSDASWVQKLFSACAKWDQFVKPRMGNSSFIILHFADKVEYESSGFLEKNRDTVIPEQVATVSQSKNLWIVNLLGEKEASDNNDDEVERSMMKSFKNGGGLLKKKKTVGNQFRESLSLLMVSLNATTPHYIRCIKPNDAKKKFVFDPHRAVQQLRACGVLETVRISATGFPSRWTYADFFGRYRVLCQFSKDILRADHRRTCEKILNHIVKDKKEYRFGKTKLFFRAGQVAFMEKMRHEKLTRCGIIIQKYVRRWLCQKRFQKIKKVALGLQRFGRGLIGREKLRALQLRLAQQKNASLSIIPPPPRRDNKELEKEKEAHQKLVNKFAKLESKLLAQQEGMGLIIVLQHRLQETQEENDRLQKLANSREIESPLSETRRTQDLLRLQELEIQNAQLQNDLTKLRTSLTKSDPLNNNSVHDERSPGQEELSRQFCKMQEELSRRQEESIQLKTVLVSLNKPNHHHPVMVKKPQQKNGDHDHQHEDDYDDDYVGLILQTQKQILIQLEKELAQEKLLRENLKKDYHRHVESLKDDNKRHQEVLASKIVSPDETAMVHQVHRLTTENLDLREKIDGLQSQLRTLERQLRATKYGQYLGMLEYSEGDEGRIIRTLVWDLKPADFIERHIPAVLPAYIIFMCVRYTDHLNDDQRVQLLLTEAISVIKKKVMTMEEEGDGVHDPDLSVLWLSNILRLLHVFRQYSENPAFQTENTPEQNEQLLKNFDLSEYCEVLSDMAIWIYESLIKMLEDTIQPLIVPAILEDDSGLSSQVTVSGSLMRSMTTAVAAVPSESTGDICEEKPLQKLIRQLDSGLKLFNSFELDGQVIQQIFKQIFYYICAGALNNLLLRKDLCHWSKGMQIRYNVSILEEWCRKNQMKMDVVASLHPIIQASQLLQARKSDKDVDALCEMCNKLTMQQVIKLLNLYTPADSYEERLPVSLIGKVKDKLLDGLSRQSATEQQKNLANTLLMDTKFSFDLNIPFNPSPVRLEEMEIPEELGLGNLVKRL